MSVATRPPRSSTPPLPTTHFNNFRPIRYQTKEELDRFFGTTSTQKREQRLRVRESDGQVYFDWIEKDEWQHLLATGSLTSPSSPAGERRRSSAMTFLTLNSPLGPASPRRASSADPLSPLAARFGEVEMAESEERRGRKRSNSVLAKTRGRVCSIGAGETYTFHSHSPRSSMGEDAIRISRLPLSRRKLDPVTMDQAFGARPQKPAALHIPTTSTGIEIQDDLVLSPSLSSVPASPMTLATFDNANSRRGTFGSLSHHNQQQQQQQRRTAQVADISTIDRLRLRWLGDVGGVATPPSSAMEFVTTPTPEGGFGTQPRQAVKVLRHAASFDVPSSARADVVASDGGWGQRQRWHSEEGTVGSKVGQVKDVQSVASLRETLTLNGTSSTTHTRAVQAQQRRRKLSSSSDGSSASETCYTPLAPRLGAKKYDKTRRQLLYDLPTVPPTNAVASTPTSHPMATAPSTPANADETRAGLRTGPEVYMGIDIPCASIHLHSDPEDNVEPALALSLSARELRRRKKKESAAAGGVELDGQVRRSFAVSRTEALAAAGKEYAKGSSRWWNHILHG